MMSPKWRFLFLAVALGGLFSGAAWAKGPAKELPGGGKNTVRKVLISPVCGERVALEGRVVRRMGPNRYLFEDSTGVIGIEVSDAKIDALGYSKQTFFQLRGNVQLRVETPPKINVGELLLRQRG